MKKHNLKKHNLKWMFAFALTFMLTFAVGKDMKVLADYSTTVSFDKEYSGTAAGSEKHKYYFTCPKSGRVTISLQTTGARLIWSLLDDNYNELVKSGWEAGSNRYVYDLAAGKYEFDITTYDADYVNDYLLTFHFDGANETYAYSNDMYIDVAEQTAIPFSKKITGQFAVNDKIDYYKLVMPTAGTVKLSMLTDIGVDLSIRNAQDDVLDSTGLYNESKNYSCTLDKGIYYLCFKRSLDSTGIYYFTAIYDMDQPTSVSAKSTSATAFKVTAKKSGDITGFQIRYRKGSGAVKTVTVKGNKNLSKSITGLIPAAYKVQVRTYYTVSGKTYYSSWSTAQSVSCKLSTPTSVKVTNSSSKALKITAKKSGTITGFSIRYRKGTGSWKTATVKGNKNLNKTITKLTKGSAYKVQVCTYITVSGKNYYSNWSPAKSVTIKK